MNDTLMAGAAQAEITPPRGTQIAGDIGRYRPAEVVIDPLFAKAVVLEQGGTRLCLIVLDILAADAGWCSEVRREVASRLGTQADAVMVHCTQSHAAPMIGDLVGRADSPYFPADMPWLRGGAVGYGDQVRAGVLEAVDAAAAALRPAAIGTASGIEGRISFNRRFFMRDGKVRTHPRSGDPNIRYAEGPIDPEVGVACITNTGDGPLTNLSMLLHFTCHPVHGYPQRHVSAGWPGAWSAGVKHSFGEDCTPLVLNGCCGNIHHANHLDPTYDEDYRRMGRLLTEDTAGLLRRLQFQEETPLAFASRHVAIPLRSIPAEQIEAARTLLAQHPGPLWKAESDLAADWDWVYAASLLDLYDESLANPLADYEVQVLRVGDLAIVGFGGEPFVELGLRVKLGSPTYPTYTLHMCNGCSGYVPTAAALTHGGYETRTGQWSRLAPQALETIGDAALALLATVF
jgi:neutral ceramidase